jgi:hypothetical protein
MIKLLKRFADRWQEPAWLLAALLVLVAGFVAIKHFDPHTGLDGFGTLWAMANVLLGAMASAWFAWWCEYLYFGDMDEETEHALRNLYVSGENPRALLVLVLRRLLWLAIFCSVFFSLV